jgi:hypothetical protein
MDFLFEGHIHPSSYGLHSQGSSNGPPSCALASLSTSRNLLSIARCFCLSDRIIITLVSSHLETPRLLSSRLPAPFSPFTRFKLRQLPPHQVVPIHLPADVRSFPFTFLIANRSCLAESSPASPRPKQQQRPSNHNSRQLSYRFPVRVYDGFPTNTQPTSANPG